MFLHIIAPDPYEGNARRHTASGYLKCAVCKYGILEDKKLYRTKWTSSNYWLYSTNSVSS